MSSSDCSSSDSSISNKCEENNDNNTNIPYEKLSNDDEDDNDDNALIEQSKMSSTESETFLHTNLSQINDTQSTKSNSNERSKFVPNNGYNSHGSSITTKSPSDNRGSIRTNSGTDNDEESDEEHYNNSSLSNNSLSMTFSRKDNTSIKSVCNKKNLTNFVLFFFF